MLGVWLEGRIFQVFIVSLLLMSVIVTSLIYFYIAPEGKSLRLEESRMQGLEGSLEFNKRKLSLLKKENEELLKAADSKAFEVDTIVPWVEGIRGLADNDLIIVSYSFSDNIKVEKKGGLRAVGISLKLSPKKGFISLKGAKSFMDKLNSSKYLFEVGEVYGTSNSKGFSFLNVKMKLWVRDF